MAYRIDENDGSIVIDGFESGVADSPYKGISDMRNANIISIPGEASVNFATTPLSQASSSGNVTSASAGADTVTITGSTFDSGAAVTFTGASLPGGIVAGTVYWAIGSGGVYQLYTNYARTSLLNITTSGTGTWNSLGMAKPKYFSYAKDSNSYWLVDALGYVWSNLQTTVNSTLYWTYTGNQINNSSNGNGLVYYQASDGTGYIFVFSGFSVDFTKTTTSNVSWNYQWNPAAGTIGTYNISPTVVLNTPSSSITIHEALVGQDNVAYYCDLSYLGSWFEKPGQVFLPGTLSTYTFAKQALKLPLIDTAQCLAELGITLLVGGIRNQIYPWDRVSTSFSYPILIADYNIQKMVTVNTNTYVFPGNRGRIYITNASQANLFKKIPDHISGTVEPYFTWGGVCSNKNQLYFSLSCMTNSGTPISQYGGVWAIDLDTDALRLTNKLSYGTYAGISSAMIPNFGPSPSGTGIYIGWDSGNSTFGIDGTTSIPYTGSQTTIDSDLIPIGTFLKRKNFNFVEYKLNQPMVSGESVTLNYRLKFNDAYTQIFIDATVGNFSNFSKVNFSNAQWIQIQAVLNSTASSPSYTRLVEMRIR